MLHRSSRRIKRPRSSPRQRGLLEKYAPFSISQSFGHQRARYMFRKAVEDSAEKTYSRSCRTLLEKSSQTASWQLECSYPNRKGVGNGRRGKRNISILSEFFLPRDVNLEL